MSDDKNQEGQEPNENLDKSEDEIRSSIVEQYELNEEEQSELINKFTADKLEEQKKLSTAIRQKRDWRTKAEEAISAEAKNGEKKEEKPQPKTEINEDEVLKRMETRFEEKFAEKELDSLNLSDELKKEVKSYSKLNDVSITASMDSPYMKFRKQEIEDKLKEEEASASSKTKSTTKDYSEMDFKDFDLSTEDGRKEYQAFIDSQKK